MDADRENGCDLGRQHDGFGIVTEAGPFAIRLKPLSRYKVRHQAKTSVKALNKLVEALNCVAKHQPANSA